MKRGEDRNFDKYLPEFIDISKANHSFVYQCLMSILTSIERLRTNKVVSPRTMHATLVVVGKEFEDITVYSTPTMAVDIKLYILSVIDKWVKDDLEREEYESCTNLTNISNKIWLDSYV